MELKGVMELGLRVHLPGGLILKLYTVSASPSYTLEELRALLLEDYQYIILLTKMFEAAGEPDGTWDVGTYVSIRHEIGYGI